MQTYLGFELPVVKLPNTTHISDLQNLLPGRHGKYFQDWNQSTILKLNCTDHTTRRKRASVASLRWNCDRLTKPSARAGAGVFRAQR